MFWQQLVNGIMLGSSYALVAVGYTLVFGVLKLLNLAHGQVFMFAPYISLYLLTTADQPLWIAVAGGMLAAAGLSVLLERLCFRPIDLRKHEIAPVLSTIGFGLMLQQIVTRVWGSDARTLPDGIASGDFHIGSVLISVVQLISLVTAAVLMVLLGLTIRRTQAGRAMRAVAENADVAELLGVNTRRVVALTFFVSGLLAGIAGILVMLRTGSITPRDGVGIGIKALAVMVVGGLGSFGGAVVAGLLIGILEVLTVAYSSAAYGDAIVWGALILVLLVRPSGLFGEPAHASGRA